MFAQFTNIPIQLGDKTSVVVSSGKIKQVSNPSHELLAESGCLPIEIVPLPEDHVYTNEYEAMDGFAIRVSIPIPLSNVIDQLKKSSEVASNAELELGFIDPLGSGNRFGLTPDRLTVYSGLKDNKDYFDYAEGVELQFTSGDYTILTSATQVMQIYVAALNGYRAIKKRDAKYRQALDLATTTEEARFIVR